MRITRYCSPVLLFRLGRDSTSNTGDSHALLSEAAVLKLRKRPIMPTLSDSSAVLTALLIGVSIPSIAPWWVVVVGTIFAIVIVKHLYGGLGQNIFNPAMAAYVMLLISFPVQMTSWSVPLSLAQTPMDLGLTLNAIFGSMTPEQLSIYKVGFDGIAMATPLDTVKTDLSLGLTITESLSKAIFQTVMALVGSGSMSLI